MIRAALRTMAINLALSMAAAAAFGSCQAQAAMPAPGEPGAPDDPRYCGEPARDAEGRIKRSRAVLRAFAKVFPCPATLDPEDLSCEGWSMNHTVPLASGGCDSVANLTWLPDSIKSCADDDCVDRWERRYHAIPRQRILLEVAP